SGTNAHNVEIFEVLPSKNGEVVFDGVIHLTGTAPRFQESRDRLSKLLHSPKVPLRTAESAFQGKLPTVDAIRSALLNTPALWGNGLIDQIDDQTLLQLAKKESLAGRFRVMTDGRYGKFGWKAQIATLHQFVGTACAGELGLSNSVRAQQDAKTYRQDTR